MAFVFAFLVRQAEPLGLDQGLFACFGRFMLDGWVPYRDVWDHKPPGLPVFYTVAFGIFGTETGSIWIMEGLWLLASAALAFLVAARLRGRWAGLVAAVTLIGAVWAPMWGGYWARAQAEELIALPLLGAGWATWRAGQRMREGLDAGRWIAAAGLLTGLAAVFKLPALALVAAWPWPWIALRGWRGAARGLALLTAGAALPWLLVAGGFAALGAGPELWEAIAVYPFHYSDAVRAGQEWGPTLWRMANAVFRGIPLAVLGAAVGLACLAWRRDPALSWLGPWVAVSAGLVVAQGQGAGYHFQILAPPLALATGVAAAELGRLAGSAASGTARAGAVLGLAALTAAAAHEAGRWVEAYAPAWRHASGRVDRDTYLAGLKYGAYEPREIERVAAGVRRTTPADEPLLIWGVAPAVYFLADRAPATRYPFHHLLLTEEPLSRSLPGLEQRREAFLEQLEADPPAMILVGRRDRSAFETRESYAQLVRFERLHEIVRRDYEVAGESSRFLVLTRRR
jgi:MFS family permease